MFLQATFVVSFYHAREKDLCYRSIFADMLAERQHAAALMNQVAQHRRRIAELEHMQNAFDYISERSCTSSLVDVTSEPPTPPASICDGDDYEEEAKINFVAFQPAPNSAQCPLFHVFAPEIR